MEIRIATREDFAGWIELAKEVELLFGPMAREASFHGALDRTIGEQRAFCVRSGDGAPGAPLCGGIMISLKKNSIGWLAVARTQRRKGIGAALLSYALQRLDANADISVNTFSEDVPDGIPARRLYRRFGFRDRSKGEPTPAGIPTVTMVRPRRAPDSSYVSEI
jgi:GNAT superfamily N-acetyltransferase